MRINKRLIFHTKLKQQREREEFFSFINHLNKSWSKAFDELSKALGEASILLGELNLNDVIE